MNKSEARSLLGVEWIAISEILGIRVIAPFSVAVAGGRELVVDALVEQFGAERGMLLVSDYSLISAYAEELVEQGFGY